jgi:ribosomal subunit interface protein
VAAYDPPAETGISNLMQLSVKGQQIDVGAALRGHMEDSLRKMLGKYFGDAIDARVTLSRTGHVFRAVVSAHVGRNIHLEAHGEADQPYPAFDAAAERLSKRLRRHKQRLRDHHKEDPGEQESLPAQQYILSGEAGENGEWEHQADQPVVVAEMTTDIPILTVSEAVMRMDLSDQPAMMFRNRAHGGLNLVYRRNDGNIGWIDPRGNRGS